MSLAAASFAHLHIHTEYSLVDGVVRIDALVRRARELQLPALAVTEQGNLFSAIKFYRAAQSHGIKPVIGAELHIRGDESAANSSRLVVLCQNMQGYRNLARIMTRSYVEGQTHGVPYVQRQWLTGQSDGLIALSCARDGDVGQALIHGNTDRARTCLAEWLALFPDRYYLELQRTSRSREDVYIDGALRLAESFAVPVVATNDVRFVEADDFGAHEARVCIFHGRTLNDPRRPRHYSVEQYLKSAADMDELFADIPEALENSLLIAQRCNLELQLGDYYLPDFPVPDEYDQDSWLRSQAQVGLSRILATLADDSPDGPEVYQARLDAELEVIINMGFAGYFLIVADFIDWAKSQHIPVGPGRGSGAGSLVAYALGITELDPIKYDLLFERFLNPERVSLPDFDIDFCMDRRDEVIEYVSERYGRDHVSQIITYGSMAAKAAIRDVGRVLGHPYGFVDQIAKLVPFDLNMTLQRALDEDDMLRLRYQEEEDVRALIDLAMQLEGLSRNAGRHAGGIVIAPKPLTEYMPLYCEQGSQVTSTQFDMGDVEAIGLVKFDFLGLRTLTIIDWAVRDINSILLPDDQEKIDIGGIALDDAETFALVCRMDTTAVFQLESDGMKKLIKRLRPDSFEELIALVALFRPGPLQSGMVDDFVDRKHGKARIQYPHPALEEILQPTYGVILYQEQVMQIAQTLAGYTLGAADLLRRAMGKKKPEEMATQRTIFVEGAVHNQVNERVATFIFDLMEKFAGYGFNKSHSAAYALLAYQTAWLKAHYPAAFMAAVLSADMDNTDKIVTLREELRRMDVELARPSVNHSAYKFTVVDAKTILYGLGAIKGVGAAAIDNIIAERGENGAFRDLFEFCRRVDSRKVNRRVLEALIRSGAADELGPSRGILLATLDKATHFAEQHAHNANAGQDDLFGLDISGVTAVETAAGDGAFVEDEGGWDDVVRLRGEKETLGFYLQGHPISRYEQELSRIISARLSEVRLGNVTVAGYIEAVRTRSGVKGKMAELRLDDRTARAHLTLYSETYQKYRSLVFKDNLVIARGEAVADDYLESGFSIVCRELYTLDDIRAQAGALQLTIDGRRLANGVLQELREMLLPARTGCSRVRVEYINTTACGWVRLGDNWRVTITDDLISDLCSLLGETNVKVEYNQRLDNPV